MSPIKICLNMIVKNENKIIQRLLESVLPLIDCYCICDTGSTDDTVSIIQTFFNSHNIYGKIVYEPFRDFGYNRTFALKQCRDMDADYILLLDADMVLKMQKLTKSEITERLPKHIAHYIFQGTPGYYYKNVRFVKNCDDISYWGVTHEYVKLPEKNTIGNFEQDELFIHDVGDGGCKADKFERDVKLLTKGLEENPNNDRYTFYLANSLRDAGRIDEAIEMFKKRVELKGWFEEVWYSLYSIGGCYKRKNDMERAVFYWLEAFEYFPYRVENMVELIKFYRERGNNKLASKYFTMAYNQELFKNKNVTPDFLFTDKDAYEYKLIYEQTVIGYYENPDNYDLPLLCLTVLQHPRITEWMRSNVLSNYKFYTPKLSSNAVSIITEKTNETLNEFSQSTPSLVEHNGFLYKNTRYVNYWIDDKGGYNQKYNVESRNVLTTRYNYNTNPTERILKHDTKYDNFYVGLEDIRLFSYKNKLLYNANRGLDHSVFTIEHGEINIENGEIINSGLLEYNEPGKKNQPIEKNWVLFQDNNEKLMCIYKWFPLTIGEITKQNGSPKFDFKTKIDTNSLFKTVRGSTNGVRIGNEIWFICHIVSYEDRRYYYHILVAIDPENYNVLRWSRLFTFENQKVEYTLGFVYFSNMFHIGYSLMDKETKIIIVEKDVLDKLFI